MSDEEILPISTRDLIKQLDEAYPPRCKQQGEDEENHQRYAGIRTLIDELIGLQEEQDDAN